MFGSCRDRRRIFQVLIRGLPEIEPDIGCIHLQASKNGAIHTTLPMTSIRVVNSGLVNSMPTYATTFLPKPHWPPGLRVLFDMVQDSQ